MLSQSTSTDLLDQIISTSPTTPEFYRTRGVVKCFKEEFTGALRDFKMALAHVKHRKRVNNVLLGKKSTLPLHNHHGNEDDECTGTESQLYFLRAACYLQYAVSLIDKAIQKVDGVERKDGEGSELRLVAVKKGTTSHHGTYSKLEEYRKELLPIMNQVQNLAKRSVRNYTHFLGFYPSSLPPFSPMNDETASKGSTPVTSRDSSPARSFKEKEDNGSSSNSHNDHQANTKCLERARKFTEKVTGLSSDIGNSSSTAISTFPKDHNHHNHHNHHHHSHHFHGFQPNHAFATYHPLLIEAWYAIAINYILVGDIHTGAMWHSRISEMHECIDGYPVFLPARSMAQADYMEVLERIKKSTNLSQHEKLKELIEVVKQKEKEREEKEREWVKHHHHHHRMLLAAAEEEKEVNEGKKSVKIGKRSKNLKQGNNNNSNIAPVIGIDGQRHHPCCPLAPGNHSSSKDHNNHHVHHSHNSGSSISASNNSYSNNNNGSPGPRQYPLHTQRADSVMMWLKSIILRQKENDGKTCVAANTSGEVKPMMNGTSTKTVDNI